MIDSFLICTYLILLAKILSLPGGLEKLSENLEFSPSLGHNYRIGYNHIYCTDLFRLIKIHLFISPNSFSFAFALIYPPMNHVAKMMASGKI